MEFLQVIAMLCQMSISTGRLDEVTSDAAQLKCQQYYLECVDKETSGSLIRWSVASIKTCIKKRSVK